MTRPSCESWPGDSALAMSVSPEPRRRSHDIKLGLKAGEPPGVWWGGGDQASTPSTDRRITRERILQHVQPAAQAVSADGIPGPGEADARGAPCARLHVLGPVRGHAVLPARARPFAAGDLRRVAQQRRQAE